MLDRQTDRHSHEWVQLVIQSNFDTYVTILWLHKSIFGHIIQNFYVSME